MGRDVLPHGVWFSTYELAKQELGRREGVVEDGNVRMSISAQVPSLEGTKFETYQEVIL